MWIQYGGSIRGGCDFTSILMGREGHTKPKGHIFKVPSTPHKNPEPE